MHLPCAPASVAVARRALSDELRAVGVFDAAVRDAALVVSELLSNAILHAYPLPGERFQVAWAVNGTSVEIAVSDGGGATVPHAGHPSAFAVSGRGLSIVAHLCQTWGVRADEVGLTVWAVLSAPRPDLAGDPRAEGGSGARGHDDQAGPPPREHHGERDDHGEHMAPGDRGGLAGRAGGPGEAGVAEAVAWRRAGAAPVGL